MLRSMFSGVSGLRSHQTMMDVIGNNIANVNTTGYKSSQVVFQDLLSQMIKGASAAQPGTGGTNPAQVGLGVRVGGVVTSFAQGAAQLTGRSTDLSISGDGFFVTQKGGETLYTRAGALSFDVDGQLVTPDGGIVLGWPAVGGAVNANGAAAPLQLPIGSVLEPKATDAVTLGGNLPASAKMDDVLTTSITVYDAKGIETPLTFEFKNTGPDSWTVTAKADTDGDGTLDDVGTQTLTFTIDATTGKSTPSATDMDVTIGSQAIKVDLAKLTQFGSQNSLTAISQTGFAMGSLQSFSIGPDGVLTGVYSNGLNRPIGQIALASFNNPGGLEKAGGSSYRATLNSGLANVGVAGSGGRGTISGGTLEMSNVDLAQEFTNLIVAQRGFQANSRVISASDELLQDLVNLKR